MERLRYMPTRVQLLYISNGSRINEIGTDAIIRTLDEPETNGMSFVRMVQGRLIYMCKEI